MGGTTRHEVFCSWVPAARAADRLARLPLGLGGDRAGIDDNGIRQPGGGRGAANDLGFERVQPTAERYDLVVRHDAQPAVSRSASNTPSKLSVSGPVMMTSPSSRLSMSIGPPSSSTSARRSV